MQLYILRHAIAVPRGTPGYPNDDRPLTDEGISKMTENAGGILEITGGFDVIISSPLTRALHTAKITAQETGYNKEIIQTEYLLPGSVQRNLYRFLSEYKKNEKALIVGHEPHLGYFASSLLGVNESVIELKKGAICRIDIEDFPPAGKGRLVYLLQPKELRLIKTKIEALNDKSAN